MAKHATASATIGTTNHQIDRPTDNHPAPLPPGRRQPTGPSTPAGYTPHVDLRQVAERHLTPDDAANALARPFLTGASPHWAALDAGRPLVLDHDGTLPPEHLAAIAGSLSTKIAADVVWNQAPTLTGHDGTVGAGHVVLDRNGVPRPVRQDGRWTRHHPDGTREEFVGDLSHAVRPGNADPKAGGYSAHTGAAHFPAPAHDPHPWPALDPGAGDKPQRIAAFDDADHAASFLSRYGIGYGHTLVLRDGLDPATATHERAARDTFVDVAGRLTVAVHGGSDHIRIGGYELSPKAFAQLLRQHPDWEQAKKYGIRLNACETGAASGDRPPFAQQLADELGVNVAAPTKQAWTSADGVTLVADVDPAHTHLPLTTDKGVIRDFVPTGSAADRPRLPDTSTYPVNAFFRDGPGHPRWQHDVVQWSAPYRTPDPALNETQPRLPWYTAKAGGMQALGDSTVVKVVPPADAHERATAVTQTLKQRLTELQNTATAANRPSVENLSRSLEKELTHEITAALHTEDPHAWTKLLRSGLHLGDANTALHVRFRLEGETQAAPAPVGDPVLTEATTKYGDISYTRVDAKKTAKGLGVLAEGFHTVGAAVLQTVVPLVTIGVTNTRHDGQGIADEVQLGNRGTNTARFGVDHRVTIEVTARARHGITASASERTDTVLTAAHPTAYAGGDLEPVPHGDGVVPPAHERIDVRNPTAIEHFDYALGGVDTKPLEDAFLRTLMDTGRLTGKQAAEIMEAATSEFLDEKSIRDRAQALFTDSLPTNFVKPRGFKGYVTLKAHVVSVQRIGASPEGGVRNDMAETVTVKHSSGHGQETSVRLGTEFNLKTGDPRKGPSAGVSLNAGLGSGHGTGTAVQGQAKTAVIHGGPQRRYHTVLRIEGQIHSDLRGHRVEDFSADLTGELLVPESQLPEADPHHPGLHDAFETALAAAPPAVPPVRRATLNRDVQNPGDDGDRTVVTRFGTATGLRNVDTWLARNHPKTYQRLRRLEADRTPLTLSPRAPFPRRGLTDDAALFRHLRRLDGPVELRFRSDYAFTDASREALFQLQESGKVILFHVADDPSLPARQFEIHEVHGEQQEALPRAFDIVDVAGPPRQFPLRHGYVLDQHGPRHGWSGNTSAPNPAHPDQRPPAATANHTPRTQSISDLRTFAPGAEENAPRVAVVVSEHRTAWLDTEVTGLRDALGDRLDERTSLHGLLTTESANRPDGGYVVNPAGKVVWGWERAPEHVPEWEHGPGSGVGTLVAMMKQAAKTGLQIVVDPGSRFAGEFRTAVEQLRADHAPNGDQPVDRSALRDRWNLAQKDGGDGLRFLPKDELLQMLVSDPGVRIVDEHGVVQRDLNARGIVQRHETEVDTSHRLREEYALHDDGTVFRSVSWRRDPAGPGDLKVGHVRRAVHDSDPLRETPDLVSGTGLGSAALKELPGAQHIHSTVRSLITKMVDNDHGAGRHGDRPGDATAGRRHAKAAAQLRFELDKQLQLTFGTPKLRGARGRGFDAGLQEEFSFRGRKYQVTVEQVLVHRDSGAIATESNLAIDHQVKGSRGTTTSVTRSGHVALEAGAGARFEMPGDEVALDLGDTGLGVSASMRNTRSLNSTAKNQSRMRAPNGVAARPEYEARYQVTVTESTRRVLGGTRERTLSRIIDESPVTVPAIVHSAFRPTAERAGESAYRAAYHDVVSTLGRTTELTGEEFDHLVGSEQRYDFARSGTDGLHATFSGLKDAVRAATNLVVDHTFRSGRQQDPVTDGPQTHPGYVAEVERALSEGFLRSNLSRLLGEGIPVPLPKEYHWGPGLPNANHSLTVRGYLVKGDPGAGHAAPNATVESYVEHDVKVSTSKNKAISLEGHTDVGPMVTFGVHTETTDASSQGSNPGSNEGGHDGAPPSESAGPSANSKRAIHNQAGGNVGFEAGRTLYNKTVDRTRGSIDISLLTETGGQRFERAHLVLEVVSTRTPVDAPTLTGPLGRRFRSAAYGNDALPRERSVRLLIENSVELSFSQHLHADVQDPGRLTPPENGVRHISPERRDAAFAAGYTTHFDDRSGLFTQTVATHPQTPVPLDAGTGIAGAIKHGLESTGLIGPEHLDDASDIWRSLSARFGPEALKAHPHDLMDVGLTHRVEIPGDFGSTRRLTVEVTATPTRPPRHLRSRDNGIVTLGGQSLKQDGEKSTSGYHYSVSGGVSGKITAGGENYGTLSSKVGYEHSASTTTGHDVVDRDIRRANPMLRLGDVAQEGSVGEEFVHDLAVEIRIYADTELPAPLASVRSDHFVASPRSEPLVTLTNPGVTMRTVVPRHFTTGEVVGADAEQAPGGARSRIADVGEQITPSALDAFLGKHLQALSFPGLKQVLDAAPAATLSRQAAVTHLAEHTGPRGGGGARGTRYDPTTDLGVTLRSTLTNRNVRDNTQDLFLGKMELPSPNGDPVLLGAHVGVGVLRPIGDATAYSGMNFGERASEPSFAAESGSNLSHGMGFSGGDHVGAGVPNKSGHGENTREREGTSGDYVEDNANWSGTTYAYGGKFSYTLKGSQGHTVVVDAGKSFEGLLPKGWAVRAAEEFPSQVVHPDAVNVLATDHAADLVARLQDRVAQLPAGETLRLVGDGTGPESVEALTRIASDLSVRFDRRVDLAVVVPEAAGNPEHLEHHVFDPSTEDHQAARNAVARQQDADREHPRLQEEADRALSRVGANDQARVDQANLSQNALNEHIAQHPDDQDALNAKARVLEQRAAKAADDAATMRESARVNQQLEKDARELADKASAAAQAAADARQVANERQELTKLAARHVQDAVGPRRRLSARDTANAALLANREAATRAGADLDGAQAQMAAAAGRSGQRGVEDAENRSDLGADHVPTHDAAVAQMWKSTASGFALADGNVHLTTAQAVPKVPGATVVAIGGFRDAGTGAHVIRNRRMTPQELGTAIVHQLTAPGAPPPPRKLVLHGDDSHAVAEAISGALPDVDVIGVRGSVGSLKSGLTVAGTVSALGNRFLLQRDSGPRWIGFRGGAAIPIPTLAATRDLTTVLATLDAHRRRRPLTPPNQGPGPLAGPVPVSGAVPVAGQPLIGADA